MKDLKKTKIQLVSELESLRQRVAQLEQTERSLEETYRFTRLAAENTIDSVWLMDMNLKTIYISPRSQRLQGYTFEEFSNLPSEKLMTPASVQLALNAFTEEMEKVRKGTKDLVISRTLELENYRRDGSTFRTESTFTLIRDENGEPTGILGVGRDITVRRESEAALAESEARYATLIESAIDGVVIIQDGVFKYINKAAEKIHGYSSYELLEKPILDFFTPESRKFVGEINRKRLAGDEVPDTYEAKIVHKNGEIRHLEISATTINLHDRPAAMAFLRDITERKRLEEALVRSEERYRSILENMQDSYFEVDLKGNFTFVNDATCLNLGHPREELVGNNFRIIMSENEAKAVFQAYHTVYLSGEPNKGFAFEVRRKDGTIGFAESSITLLKNELGETVGFRCVGRDVTERKQIEEELRRSEERYRLLAENVSDVIWTMNMNMQVTYISPSVTAMQGYTPEEAIRLRLDQSLTPESMATAISIFQDGLVNLQAGTSPPDITRTFEAEFIRKDGTKFWTETRASVIQDGSGKAVGVQGVTRDISERKQMEQQLAEMATHDFLTGLPNRFLLTDRFSIAAAQAHRKDANMALLLLDLDKFKAVNDTLGHSVGDKLLQAIGERLSSIIRSSDTVARLGGDEFLLLLPEIVHLDDAEKIAKKIADAFNEPFIINGNSLRISISIGIAIYPEDGTDLEALMQKSDLDMYRAKKSDRSR